MKAFKLKQKIVLLLALSLVSVDSLWAAPPHYVKYTVHNLGTTGTGPFSNQGWDTSSTATEVCIFCHTPHNAVAGKKFLWNRSDSAATFSFYTASVTLTSAVKNVSTIGEESKMCMSCHDGVTAMNAMANPVPPLTWDPTGDQIGDLYFPGSILGVGVNIGGGLGDPANSGGGNLTNDHPISFSYTLAQSLDSQLKAISVPKGMGLMFWGPNQDKLECVTCHDPHINYGVRNGLHNGYDPLAAPTNGGDKAYIPFLRRSNSSSGLCFACHNK